MHWPCSTDQRTPSLLNYWLTLVSSDAWLLWPYFILASRLRLWLRRWRSVRLGVSWFNAHFTHRHRPNSKVHMGPLISLASFHETYSSSSQHAPTWGRTTLRIWQSLPVWMLWEPWLPEHKLFINYLQHLATSAPSATWMPARYLQPNYLSYIAALSKVRDAHQEQASQVSGALRAVWPSKWTYSSYDLYIFRDC